MSTIIQTTNLTKKYGEQVSVHRLNMTVKKGEIYGFLGRNGAGKTTTIKMLLGLTKPTEGEIELFGETLLRNKKRLLTRIGAIVETPGFYENLTARENLIINARIIGIHKKRAVEEALETVGLEKETKKLVGKYSLGMKQRLGIARALLHEPELLILDEPTNGLDPIGIKEMRKLIISLAQERNITILISSHILFEVEQLAHRIGIIHKGELLEELDMDKLHTLNKKHIEFLVSDESKAAYILEEKLGISRYQVHEDGIIRVYSHLYEQHLINKELVLGNVDVFQMKLSEDHLEDYFINLVGGGTIG
ncbi:ABC transporter ATP-binding protein [Priestia endophytica]|uniref:ABC transporter ATP-binding protein n=1 Tax=Priestia endophytica TaxID=135735 RepID=UPI00203E3CF7|nr:ABC transporter ATP-binding protein [Priestia endophytica]MCM3538540.1 ABC transporter ATP-binding protein [Priestia endophytica]